MKLLLVRCGVCDNWYKPDAHRYHCPVCSATPIIISGRRKYFHLLASKPIEIVRGARRTVPLIAMN